MSWFCWGWVNFESSVPWFNGGGFGLHPLMGEDGSRWPWSYAWHMTYMLKYWCSIHWLIWNNIQKVASRFVRFKRILYCTLRMHCDSLFFEIFVAWTMDVTCFKRPFRIFHIYLILIWTDSWSPPKLHCLFVGTVDWWFRNPAPVEVGSLSRYLIGFIHHKWLLGISSIKSMTTWQLV